MLVRGRMLDRGNLGRSVIHTGAARNYAGQYLAERSGRDTRIERNRKQETKNKR